MLRCAIHIMLISCSALLSGAFTAPACAAACGEISTFADGLRPLSEIHVATDGSNPSGDGSATNPYATIAYAAQQATPGMAIVVHPGVYAGGGFIEDLWGAPDAPIWIGSAPGIEPRPIIHGGTEGLHFIRARYVVIHDLEVREAAANGINCDDGGDVDDPLASHHLVFRNLFIHDIGGAGNQDGLKLSGINDYFVIDCQIDRCGGGNSGSGIDHVGCHHGLIANCQFNEASGNAVQCKGGSEDIEIRWCRFVDAGQRSINIGGSTGFEFFRPPLSTTQPNVEARDIRVLSNVFQGSIAPIAFVGCVESIVSNNTIIDPTNWLIRILQETTSSGMYEFLPCSNNTFRNNILHFDESDLSTYINIGPGTSPMTFTYANNLWYAHDNPAVSMPTGLMAPEIGGVYGLDPLLADPKAGDVGITARSPAAGAGQSPALTAGDLVGWCYANPPSIGAAEVQADADLNGDGIVNGFDLALLLGQWTGAASYTPCPPHAPADLNADCTINGFDLALLLGAWG